MPSNTTTNLLPYNVYNLILVDTPPQDYQYIGEDQGVGRVFQVYY